MAERSKIRVERLLYTAEEVMEMLGIKSAKTLNKVINAGKLRYILIGRSRRFDIADVREFIERGKIQWAASPGQSFSRRPLRLPTLEEARAKVVRQQRKRLKN
jgi:excisionase family DNA binding protein